MTTTTSSDLDTRPAMVPAPSWRPWGNAGTSGWPRTLVVVPGIGHLERWRRTPRRRRRVALWSAVVVAVLLVVATVGAAFVHVPYYTLRPGSVRSLAHLITVDEIDTYAPAGEVGFTTVSIGQATLLEALGGWLDDDIDVIRAESIRGGRSDDENRQLNVQLMDTSKVVATAVALDHLGYEVEVITAGTLVRDVVPQSPAAGVVQPNDVITSVDGTEVDGIADLSELLQVGGPGAEHVLTIERLGADPLEVEIQTTAPDDDPERAVIGVLGEDRIVDISLPFAISIDSADVGGPSAGLAFTLALLEVLTPGELTGGHKVAVTGTIAIDGTIGQVGGAAQKAIAVRDAGYDAFLVPTAEHDDVVDAVGDDLRVFQVSTLSDALDALDALGGNATASAASAPGA